MFFEGDDCKKGKLELEHFCWALQKILGLNFIPFSFFNMDLIPAVQKLDSAIHRMNFCPVDNAVGFS